MSAKPNYEFIEDLDLDDQLIDQVLELSGLTSQNDDPKAKLYRLLFATEQGSNNVMLSPIAKKIDPLKILDRWDEIYNSSEEYMSENLISLDDLNRDKFGPRSIAQPWEARKSGVLEYFSVDSSVESEASDAIADLFQSDIAAPHSLRPLSVESAIKFVKNSTNSGLPFLTRKSGVKPAYEVLLQEIAAREDPCVLYTRTAEQGRTRATFGFPMADTILEMLFYRPLLEYQKRLGWRTSLKGPKQTDSAIWQLILKAEAYGWFVVSSDCSRFDTTIKRTLQYYSFEYIKTLFQLSYSEVLTGLFERFNTIGLVTPDGILEGPGGIRSGSTFTNEVGSIAQYLILKSAGLLEEWFNIQGDDAVYICSDPDEVMDWYTKCGVIVNKEKSYVMKGSCVYLQSLYDLEHYSELSIGGIYPVYRALNRILYPERFIQFVEGSISGQDYFSIRTIAILENCKYHPLFSKFVRFIYDLDSYKLSYSERGLRDYVKLVSQTKGKDDVIKNQYGEDVGSLSQFETVKLIQSF